MTDAASGHCERLKSAFEETVIFYGTYNRWIEEALANVERTKEVEKLFERLMAGEIEWGNRAIEHGEKLEELRRAAAKAAGKDASLSDLAGLYDITREFCAAEAAVRDVLHKRVELIRKVESCRDEAAEEIHKIDASRKLHLQYNPRRKGSKLDGHV